MKAVRQAPYPFDRDAFAVGKRHFAEGRYSLIQSTGPGWVYWYELGRVAGENAAARA